MTTITIDRALLEQALEVIVANTVGAEDIEDALRAALAAPATVPEQPRPFVPWSKEAEMVASWTATAPEQPSWQDAPTKPGVWLCDEGDICYTWTAHNIEILDQFDPGNGLRWFGPISPDTGDKP